MPKAPDYLSNLFVDDPNYIEDSPQFRRLEQQTQKRNLNAAANQALRLVDERTKDMAINTIQTQRDMIRDMTPTPIPLQGPSFFPDMAPEENTPLSPNIPGPAEFDTEPVVAPDPLNQETTLEEPAPLDPMAEVEYIAQMTGMTPQQVASMVMLGKDIEQIENANQQQPQSTELLTPTPPPRLAGPPPESISSQQPSTQQSPLPILPTS